MSGRRYLVTGGTGFIGSALVRSLVLAGHSVRSLDNGSRGRAERLSDIAHDVELLEGDVRDPVAVSRAVAGMDCVCHLAYINGTEFFYSMPETILDVAVRGMTNVIDACLRHGVGDLVLASSSEVYQTPTTIPTDETTPLVVPDVRNPRYSYGGGKIISELMTLNYGRKHFRRAVIFRPHNVFGPDMGWEHVIPQFAMRMHRLVAETPTGMIEFPIRGDGKATRAFISIESFTDGVMRVVERGEHLGIYHVGSTNELSVADLARRVAACFGRDVRIVPGAPVPGETDRRCPAIDLVQELGFRPAQDFQQALERTVRWYALHAAEAPVHVAGTAAKRLG
jgi:nucleoside-diphosphate-sugar epimerase